MRELHECARTLEAQPYAAPAAEYVRKMADDLYEHAKRVTAEMMRQGAANDGT